MKTNLPEIEDGMSLEWRVNDGPKAGEPNVRHGHSQVLVNYQGAEIATIAKDAVDEVKAALTVSPWVNTKLLRSAVRTLNAQHMSTSAGFYSSTFGGRFFKARAKAGVLEVFDWDNWTPISEANAIFHDHNGCNLPLA